MKEKANKIRVLQVNKLYYPWIGGVEKVVQDIAEGLNGKMEIEVLACQSFGKGKVEYINGVKVTKAGSVGIFWGMPISFSFPFLLAKKMREVDIIHFHMPFPLADISFLLFRTSKPRIVVTYHSDIVRQKKLMLLYKHVFFKFLNIVDKIIVTSPNMKENSVYLKSFKNKCSVVPLGVDTNYFESLETRKIDLPINGNEKIILFVGRLTYYKGVEYLIEAIQWVKNSKLLIVGDGKLRAQLEEKSKLLGVQERVIFLGKLSQEELKYCYEICDLFVLPSVDVSEAFGLVQAEAMFFGKPVVNTNLSSGVTYVSVNGETGITVPPRDSKALSKAINKILENRDLYDKFSVNAKNRVYKLFTKEKMLNLILQIYNELISSSNNKII
jgi:rhamnosyl/mannosyltransferase